MSEAKPSKPKGAESMARRIMGYATNPASKDFDRIEIISRAIEEFAEQEACELVNTAVDLCNKARHVAVSEARAEERELVIKLGGIVAKDVYDKGLAEGFAECREMAAKVAETAWANILGLHGDKVRLRNDIANKIRALRSGGKERKG